MRGVRLEGSDDLPGGILGRAWQAPRYVRPGGAARRPGIRDGDRASVFPPCPHEGEELVYAQAERSGVAAHRWPLQPLFAAQELDGRRGGFWR